MSLRGKVVAIQVAIADPLRFVGRAIRTICGQAGLATRLARVLFTVDRNVRVLLHGFVKKERKTPRAHLELAKHELKKVGSAE